MKRFTRKTLALMSVMALLIAGYGTSDALASATSKPSVVSAVRSSVGMTAPIAYVQGTLMRTQNGLLEGYKAGGALHWDGVSYAKAPVGTLRWKAPQPLDRWNGIKEAKKSRVASQTASLQASKDKAGNGEVKASTKLLGDEAGAVTLDITRPDSNETNLPILFYIHGGNNQTGKSAALPASSLAQETNSVIISINHRLGLLGFNALPAIKKGTDKEKSGNYALLDIAAALDWVNANAPAFGGNPHNITISGSSAGGRDVMAMLISPLFKGKFQKAISFSGGMTVADPEASARVDARHIAPLAVKKGIKTDEKSAEEWLLTDGDDVHQFLFELSDEELAGAFGGAAIRMSAFPHLFTDGVVLPKNGFDTTNYNAVPILMVNGDREFSTFCKSTPPFKAPKPADLMADPNLLAQYKFAEKYGSMMYSYFNGEESASRMLGKYNAPIYTCLIRWGDNPEICGEEYATIYGAYHCMTTPLMTHIVTNASAGYPDLFASASCKNVSAMLNGYYKNFLWTGNPNGANLPHWDHWKSLNGKSQLIVDADDEKAWASMSTDHTSYAKILTMIDADHSIPKEQEKYDHTDSPEWKMVQFCVG